MLIIIGYEASTTSFLVKNSFMNGCTSISCIVGLLSGLKCNVLLIRSSASGEILVNHYLRFFGLIFVRISNISFPKSVLSDFKSWIPGGPVQVMTLSIWFKVEFPGNIGFPLIISPNMHPKLQTSAGFEYRFDPSKIYGARYHLVAMYSVISGGRSSPSWWIDLTRPKSQILARQSSLTRTLEGLISRWISSAEWR